MKRLGCLLLCLLILAGCAPSKQPEPIWFSISLENQAEEPIHGFGVEWYEDGMLVKTGSVMAKDFLFVATGETLACRLELEADPGNKRCALRVYVIGEEHAAYGMEQPMPVSFEKGAVGLTLTGSQKTGWRIQ